jgi:rhamnosyltransferase
MVNNHLVAVIVVLYNPDYKNLANLVNTACHCNRLIAVLNSSCSEAALHCLSDKNIIILEYKHNAGTAGGFNRGIKYALETGSESFVLLLDQDSTPTDSMIDKLISAFNLQVESGLKIGAVGPRLQDIKESTAVTYTLSSQQSNSLIQVDSIASSGTLLNRNVFNRVGLMDETLFLDAVDHEWCLRAKALSYIILKVPSAILLHNMGDLVVTWFGKTHPLHRSSVRHYYIIRNSILLLKRTYIQPTWRLKEILLTIRRFFGYIYFSQNKKETIYFMCKGVWHGIISRGGPY